MRLVRLTLASTLICFGTDVTLLRTFVADTRDLTSLTFISDTTSINLPLIFKNNIHTLSSPVYNTCTLLLDNEKYVDANLDAPDNAISGNESSSEMLTSQSYLLISHSMPVLEDNGKFNRVNCPSLFHK